MVLRLTFAVFFLSTAYAQAACDWAERAERSGKSAIAMMQYMYCAEEENDPEAQYKLGAMFYQGKDLKKPDFRRAVIYFAHSARNGYAPAQAKLGLLYWRGEGISKNMVQAYKWLYLSQEPQEVRWFYKAGPSSDSDARTLYRQIRSNFEAAANTANSESAILKAEVIPFQHENLLAAGKKHLTETEYKALEDYLTGLTPALLTTTNFDLKKVPVLNTLKNKMYPPAAN